MKKVIFIAALIICGTLPAQTPKTTTEKKEKYTIKLKEVKDGKTWMIDTTFDSKEAMEAFMKSTGHDVHGQANDPLRKEGKQVVLVKREGKLSESDSLRILTEVADSNVFILNGEDSVQIGNMKVIHRTTPGRSDVHVEQIGDQQVIFIDSDTTEGGVKRIQEIVIDVRMELQDLSDPDRDILFHGKKTKALDIQAFHVSPNPASKQVNITFNGMQGDATMRILDPLGKEIVRKEVSGINGNFAADMDLPELNDGVYYIQVMQGKKYFTKKLVITK